MLPMSVGAYTTLHGMCRGYPILVKNSDVIVLWVLYMSFGGMVVAGNGYVTIGR